MNVKKILPIPFFPREGGPNDAHAIDDDPMDESKQGKDGVSLMRRFPFRSKHRARVAAEPPSNFRKSLNSVQDNSNADTSSNLQVHTPDTAWLPPPTCEIRLAPTSDLTPSLESSNDVQVWCHRTGQWVNAVPCTIVLDNSTSDKVDIQSRLTDDLSTKDASIHVVEEHHSDCNDYDLPIFIGTDQDVDTMSEMTYDESCDMDDNYHDYFNMSSFLYEQKTRDFDLEDLMSVHSYDFVDSDYSINPDHIDNLSSLLSFWMS